jgi:hypothetical protein
MDSANNLSQSILQSSEVSIPSAPVSNTSDGTSGFFDFFKSINLTTWIIIFLILAFLGFNIFVYLAKGTQDITNFFTPLFQKIFGTTVALTGQAVDVTAEGAKAVVGGTAGVINTGLTTVQNITPNAAPSSIKSQPIQTQNVSKPNDNGLHKALNSSQSQNMDYQAHQASSSVASMGEGSGKSGWCYIGEEKGFRTCALVNEDDKCMSGDIFPSHEICINPSLRP